MLLKLWEEKSPSRQHGQTCGAFLSKGFGFGFHAFECELPHSRRIQSEVSMEYNQTTKVSKLFSRNPYLTRITRFAHLEGAHWSTLSRNLFH